MHLLYWISRHPEEPEEALARSWRTLRPQRWWIGIKEPAENAAVAEFLISSALSAALAVNYNRA